MLDCCSLTMIWKQCPEKRFVRVAFLLGIYWGSCLSTTLIRIYARQGFMHRSLPRKSMITDHRCLFPLVTGYHFFFHLVLTNTTDSHHFSVHGFDPAFASFFCLPILLFFFQIRPQKRMMHHRPVMRVAFISKQHKIPIVCIIFRKIRKNSQSFENVFRRLTKIFLKLQWFT